VWVKLLPERGVHAASTCDCFCALANPHPRPTVKRRERRAPFQFPRSISEFGFKDRWFEPVFISLPLLLFAAVREQLKSTHAKTIAVMGSIVAFLVLGIIPGRIIWAEKIGMTQLLNAPYRQMAGDLAASISPDALVIAESKWVGENLRMLVPDLNVVTPELVQLYPTENRKLAMVWDGSRREAPGLSANLFLETMGLHLEEPVASVEANYQFHRDKVFRLGISGLKRTNDARYRSVSRMLAKTTSLIFQISAMVMASGIRTRKMSSQSPCVSRRSKTNVRASGKNETYRVE